MQSKSISFPLVCIESYDCFLAKQSYSLLQKFLFILLLEMSRCINYVKLFLNLFIRT